MVYFTVDEALAIVEEYMHTISPYSIEVDKDGKLSYEIIDTDKRSEFLLGLATLVVHIVERENV